MSALDYLMGFGYKGQDGQYYGPHGSVGLYHLGNDYYAPLNTPLIVSGTQLGLSGNTGIVGGPHVHVAKWLNGNISGGYYVSAYGRSYFDPSDVKGIEGVVIETGKSSDAGNFVRVKAANGYTYEFFHMNRIDVKVNDKVGGSMGTPLDVLRIIASEIEGFDLEQTHGGAYDKMLTDAWGGQPPEAYVRHAWSVQPKKRQYLLNDANALAIQNSTLTGQVTGLTDANRILTTDLKTSNDMVDDLRKQNIDLQKKLDALNNGDAIIITRKGFNALFDFLKQWFSKNNG